MMLSTTNDAHINTTAITTVERFIFSDSSLPETINVCEESDYNKDYYKDDDDLVELEEVGDETCNDMDQCDDDDGEEERDLTNLTWLTELRSQTISFGNMPSDEEKQGEVTVYRVGRQKHVHVRHNSKDNNELLQKSSLNAIEQAKRNILIQDQKSQEPHAAKTLSTKQSKRPSPTERYEMFLNKIKRDFEIYEQSAINFQSDITEKPPFNYSHIIGMAMLESGRHVTLQQICSWIEVKFAFFRVRKKWNNSIRHNLSLHPCFRKIGRNKEDKGKGGYWELGVDPKKCDRKRIRSRKTSSHTAKAQNKQSPTFSKASKKNQQHLSKSISYKCISGYVKPFLNLKERDYEELYLDDSNVQQNIEVMSSNSTSCFYKVSETDSVPGPAHVQIKTASKTKDEEEFLTDLNDSICMQNEAHMKEFNNCPFATDHVPSHHPEQSLLAHSRHHEYKLGTIIISSSKLAELESIHNTNSNTHNSLISTCSIKQFTESNEHTTKQQHQHNIVSVLKYVTGLS